MKALALAAAFLLLASLMIGGAARAEQIFNEAIYTSMAGPTESIPAGTKITIQNWQQYRRFMSMGLQAIMSQQYFWKVPANAVIEVGPTIKIGLPKKYRDDTEKYHNQVKLVPEGEGYSISGRISTPKIRWPASSSYTTTITTTFPTVSSAKRDRKMARDGLPSTAIRTRPTAMSMKSTSSSNTSAIPGWE
jgi:hypothetical protein